MRKILTLFMAVMLAAAAGTASARDLVLSTSADSLEIPAQQIDKVAIGYNQVTGHYLELKLGKKATAAFAEFTQKHNGRSVSTKVGDLVVSKGVRIMEMITSGELVLSGIAAETAEKAFRLLRDRMQPKKQK